MTVLLPETSSDASTVCTFGRLVQDQLQDPASFITIAGHIWAIADLHQPAIQQPLKAQTAFPHHIWFSQPYDVQAFLQLQDRGLTDLLQWLLPLGASTVLDLGCGAGKVSWWLQERGHRVMACDLDPAMVELSHSRGVQTCILSDYRDLQGPFDAVLMLGGGIPIPDEPVSAQTALQAFLDQVKSRLNPGGLLVFDLMNYDGPGMGNNVGHGFEVQFQREQCSTAFFQYLALNRDVLARVLQAEGWTGLIEQVTPAGPFPSGRATPGGAYGNCNESQPNQKHHAAAGQGG